MKHIEEEITGSDNNKLFTQRYELEDSKGAVIILHGYCEHSQRYGYVVEKFLADGYSCYLMDHRGHGKSEGRRAAVIRFEEYLADVDIFVEHVKSHYKSDNLFLLGHSLGGLITVNYMLSRKPDFIDGVILSSPYLGLKAEVPAWKSTLGTLISKVFPAVSLASDLDPHLLTHDEAIVEEYISDASISKIANSRWFTESNESQEYCLKNASQWAFPSLIMHGGDDRIADPQTTRDFFAKISSGDLSKLVIYEGMYHEIFNEIDRNKVIADTVLWLNQQIEGSK